MLILPKLLMFTSFLSMVGWSRYGTILLLQTYTPYEIGLLRSIGYLPKVLSGPVWSILSDTTSPTATLLLSYTIGLVSFSLVRTSLKNHWPFWLFACLRFARSATNAISPLTDAVILNITQGTKNKKGSDESYGQQRVFSSLAWGLGSLFVGKLIDIYGVDIIFGYTQVTIVLSMLFTCLIHRQMASEQTTATTTKNKEGGGGTARPNPLRVIADVVRKHPETRRFSAQVALLGLVMTLSDTVLPMHIELLEGSRVFNGASTLIGILGGVPFFWYSKQIYQKKGVWFMLRLASYLLTVRLLVMYYVRSQSDFWLLLLIQPLHGVTFSLMLTGSIEYLTILLPYSTSSTAVNTLFFTVGHGVGNVFWMKLLEMNGNVANELYAIGACMMIVNFAMGGTRGGGELVVEREKSDAEEREGILLKVV